MKRKMDGATKRFIAVCTIPTFILYFIFVLYPIVNMFGLSFVQWNGLLGKKTFYGLKNYIILFQDSQFWKSFENTIILIVLVTIVTFILALLFASIPEYCFIYRIFFLLSLSRQFFICFIQVTLVF